MGVDIGVGAQTRITVDELGGADGCFRASLGDAVAAAFGDVHIRCDDIGCIETIDHADVVVVEQATNNLDRWAVIGARHEATIEGELDEGGSRRCFAGGAHGGDITRVAGGKVTTCLLAGGRLMVPLGVGFGQQHRLFSDLNCSDPGSAAELHEGRGGDIVPANSSRGEISQLLARLPQELVVISPSPARIARSQSVTERADLFGSFELSGSIELIRMVL